MISLVQKKKKFIKTEDRMNLEDEDESPPSDSFLSFAITDPQLRCSPDRPPYVESGIMRILGSIDIHIFVVSGISQPSHHGVGLHILPLIPLTETDRTMVVSLINSSHPALPFHTLMLVVFNFINTSNIVHCNRKTQQSPIGVEIESCKLASPCKWVSVGDLCMKEVLCLLGVSPGALEMVVQGFQRARMSVGQR